MVKAIESKKAQQARHKKQAAARRQLDKAVAESERETQRLVDLRTQFDAIRDLASLIEFGEFYVLTRHRKPLLERGDDDIFVPYLKLAQDYAPKMYEALKAGVLTVNQVVVCLMPLAEIRTRNLLKGLPKQDATDAEDVANQSLYFGVLEALERDDIKSFAGYLVRRIDGDVKDFKKKEWNARRFVDADGVEGSVECASVIGIDFERRVDRRARNELDRIDALDELHALAADDIDRQILDMRIAGHRDAEIGTAVGLSKSAVNKRRRVMEIRLMAVANDTTDERIITLKAKGKTDKAIGRELHISPANVVARHTGMERKWDRQSKELSALLVKRNDALSSPSLATAL